MCIYYTNRKDLHYDSREHIIPAAIGGKLRLPADYVSSEFNNDISKLEREFIQKSLVAMPREIEGPGKRGKLGQKFEKKSEVFVVRSASDPNLFALGYIQKGNTSEIDQVVYDITTGVGQVRVSSVQALHDFKANCVGIDEARLRTIIDNSLPVETILFGISKEVEEHYEFFFAKNELNKLTLTQSIVEQFGEGIRTDETGQRDTYQPLLARKFVFEINYLRVYAKIAFNYLAHKSGKEFVLRSQFDPVREWISVGGPNIFASLGSSKSNPFRKGNIPLPESSHVIYLRKVRNMLTAKVFLYESLGIDILLSDTFEEPFDSQGFICDWKNQKEYELLEYLRLFYSKEL